MRKSLDSRAAVDPQSSEAERGEPAEAGPRERTGGVWFAACARNEQQENGETIPVMKREQTRAGSGEPATERRSARAVNRKPCRADDEPHATVGATLRRRTEPVARLREVPDGCFGACGESDGRDEAGPKRRRGTEPNPEKGFERSGAEGIYSPWRRRSGRINSWSLKAERKKASLRRPGRGERTGGD